MIENIYDCPINVWEDFNNTEKEYYNFLRKEFEYKNHTYFIHHNTNRFLPEEWNTLVHNIVTLSIWRIFKPEPEKEFIYK